MKTSEKQDYPKWLDLIHLRYNDRFIFLFQKLQDQLTELLGECPSDNFFNEYVCVLRNQSLVNPVSALWESIDRTFGLKFRAIDFPRKNKEISQTSNELKHVLLNVSFM